jgi:hypothetical protein
MKNDSAQKLAQYIDEFDDEYDSLREFILEGNDPKDHILFHAAVVGEWEDNFWDNVRKYQNDIDTPAAKR